MDRFKRALRIFIYMNAIALITSWASYSSLVRDVSSPVHYDHLGFWEVMQPLVIIGVLLSAWLAFWDSLNPKFNELSDDAICEKGADYWIKRYVLSMTGRWLGIAVWAFFGLRILYLGQTAPAAFTLPGYLALAIGVILVFSAVAYFYYRSKLFQKISPKDSEGAQA